MISALSVTNSILDSLASRHYVTSIPIPCATKTAAAKGCATKYRSHAAPYDAVRRRPEHATTKHEFKRGAEH